MPLVQQWNIGIQRQLPLSLTLEVNYIGNHALHLSYNLNENVVPLASVPAVQLANTSVTTQNSLQFPNLKQFTVNNNSGGSNYNGLQVSVRRQFNTRLAVLSNYTYSKTMDDGSTIYNFSAPNGTANSQYAVAGPNFIKDLAPSNIDVGQVFNLACGLHDSRSVVVTQLAYFARRDRTHWTAHQHYPVGNGRWDSRSIAAPQRKPPARQAGELD